MSTLLLLKLGDQMLCPYIIQTASNCVALKAAGVRTSPQNDAATNPPIQEKTLTFAHKKLMLTELNNKCVKAILQTVFSIKSDICKVVPVCAMQAFRVVDVQLHTHTTSALQ